MTDETTTVSRAERADRLFTVASGWGALLLFLFGIHRLISVWGVDWWGRAALILSLGLFVTWVWGFWSEITAKLRGWARGGGLNATVVAVGLVIALVIVNTLVRRQLPWKMDLTKNQRFTLAPRTREILKSLKSPVQATVYIPAGRSSSRIRDLFRQYADASPKFQWKKVDPLVDQTALLAENPPPKLNSTDLTGAILKYENRREDVTEFTEKAVTSAILKLTRETPRKILFLTGHGEPDVSGTAAGDPRSSIQLVVADLKDTNWPVESVDLYRKDARALSPDEVALLVIAGPRRELADVEQKRINEYLNAGGRVLLLLEDQGPSYSRFLAGWGIQTANDVVFGETQGGGLLVIQPGENAHEAVKKIGRVVMAPLHSVTKHATVPAGVTVTEVLDSGPMSRVASNYKRGDAIDPAAAKPGPTGIAQLAEKTIGTGDTAKKARLLVVGGNSWATDQWTRLPFFNGALAANLINYLGEEEALVSIPPRDENTEQAFLTPEQGRMVNLVHLVDFPLLALLLALAVYFKRR